MAISTGSINIDLELEVNFPKEGGTISTDVFINNATSWSLECPLSWSLVNETISAGNRILKVAFTAPSNSANAVVNIPAKFTAWNSRESVSADLPVTIAPYEGSTTSEVLLPLLNSTVLPTGSTQAVIPVMVSSSCWNASKYEVDFDIGDDWVIGTQTTFESGSNPYQFIAYTTISLEDNRTGVDRTNRALFSLVDNGHFKVGNLWEFTQPTKDIILFTDKANPYVIGRNPDGKVPGLNLNLPIMYSTNFQDGTILYRITPGDDPNFHISTHPTTMSIGNGYVTRSYNTQWAQNFTPFPRTGSLSFTLNSGSEVVDTLVWEVRQAPFISYPYIQSVDSNNYAVGAQSTQQTIGVTYYMGSNGSTILTPVVMNNNWPITIVGQNEVETGNILTRKFYYTTSFAANIGNTSRTNTIQFRISSGSKTNTGSVVLTQDAATGTQGYLTASPTTQTVTAASTDAKVQVCYVGVPAWTVQPVSCSLPCIESVLSQDSSQKVMKYTFTVPVNESTQPRAFPAYFSMVSGSKTESVSATINQQGKTKVPEINFLTTNPYQTSYQGGEVPIDVQYSNSYSPTSTSVRVSSGGARFSIIEEATSFVGSGNNFTGHYVVQAAGNPGQSSITGSILFSVNHNGTTEASKTFQIYVPASSSSGGLSIGFLPASPQYVNWNLTRSVIEVTYNGINSVSNVLTPSYTGKITSVSRSSYTERPDKVVCNYEVRYTANSSSNQATNLLTFGAAGGGSSVSKQYTLYQRESSSTPSGFYIRCPETVSFSSDRQTGVYLGTVYYGGISSSRQVGYESSYRPTNVFGIHQIDEGWSGDEYYRTYTIDLYANTGSGNFTSYVWWPIINPVGGGWAISASTAVVQTPGGSTPSTASVSVSPEYTTVQANNTSTNLIVTYSGATNYNIAQPVTSSGTQIQVLNSSSEGGNLVYWYNFTYPVNSRNTSINRTAAFSMTSGSDTKSATATVTQQGASTQQAIVLNTSVVSLPYYATTARIEAHYYGISSVDAVTLPSCNVGSWSGTIVRFQEEDGHVSVIWDLNGDANSGDSSRQILFTFNAIGIESSATLVINQAAFNGGTVVGSGIIPAWKDTETVIGNGDSWEAICRDTNGTVLFDERMYKAPDKAYLSINFNRLAESFLEPREFPTAFTTTPVFFFTTNLREGGQEVSYEYRVVDDWSYNPDVNVEVEYSLSKPYQNELAIGQYLVYSVLRTPGTSDYTLRILNNGSPVAASTPANYSYFDLSYKVNNCGTWGVQLGKAGQILASWKTVNARYVLYYYNKYGGWDSFVIKGPVIPSVDVTRNTYLNYRKNSRTYQNGVVGKFKVNTGILTDNVSPVVTEFAASPRLVLHELDRDILIPVKVTTNSIERKTFFNQGRQFAKYEFDLEADLSQIRR